MMQISAAGTPDVTGMAQILMLRKAMDMALASNAQLLAALPQPASPPGIGANLDVSA